MKYLTASAAALGLSLAVAAPTHAQVNAANLVNVNLSDIAVDIADVLDVNVDQVPVTVQVPIGVAATVCDVNANVLAEQAKAGGANCDAQNTSQALNQIVQKQIG